jgi:hypothetical protein
MDFRANEQAGLGINFWLPIAGVVLNPQFSKVTHYSLRPRNLRQRTVKMF